MAQPLLVAWLAARMEQLSAGQPLLVAWSAARTGEASVAQPPLVAWSAVRVGQASVGPFRRRRASRWAEATGSSQADRWSIEQPEHKTNGLLERTDGVSQQRPPLRV